MAKAKPDSSAPLSAGSTKKLTTERPLNKKPDEWLLKKINVSK
jgi:hypothetical protein